MKNWYIVQSHSSFENKVAGLIKEEADKAKISDKFEEIVVPTHEVTDCLLYTSPSPRDGLLSRMPSSA